MQSSKSDSNSHSNEELSLKQKILSTGNSILGKFDPVNKICDHILGLHFYSGNLKRQLFTHHYCSIINEDFRQCLLYDSNKKDAKLIGVEFVISEKLYKTLPDEEKKLWHSLAYEIKAGILQCPRLPLFAEKEVMRELLNRYGKTFHFWQVDRGDSLPIGEPKLMWTVTKDNQADPNLLKQRDQEFDVKTQDLITNREDLEFPKLIKGADSWENGKWPIVQVKQQEKDSM